MRLLLLFLFVGFFELAVEYPCLNQREIKKKTEHCQLSFFLCIVHWGVIFHHMSHSQFAEGTLDS